VSYGGTFNQQIAEEPEAEDRYCFWAQGFVSGVLLLALRVTTMPST
jgi:hypothetical protein